MMNQSKIPFKKRMKQLVERSAQVSITMKHPGAPWYAKVVGFIAIVYALSPIDLIPDFIPVLGYLDDLIILPLLILLFIKLVPKEIWDQSEEEAKSIWQDGKPYKWYFAIPFILFWISILFWILYAIVS